MKVVSIRNELIKVIQMREGRKVQEQQNKFNQPLTKTFKKEKLSFTDPVLTEDCQWTVYVCSVATFAGVPILVST